MLPLPANFLMKSYMSAAMKKEPIVLYVTALAQLLIAPESANGAVANPVRVSLPGGPVFRWLARGQLEKMRHGAGTGGIVTGRFRINPCPALRFILSGLSNNFINFAFWIGHIILLFSLLSLTCFVDKFPL